MADIHATSFLLPFFRDRNNSEFGINGRLPFSSDTRLREDEAVQGTTKKADWYFHPDSCTVLSLSNNSNITFIKTKFYGQGNIQIHVPVRNCIILFQVFRPCDAMAVRNND